MVCNEKKGFATLLSVLIVLAIASTLSLAILFQGVGASLLSDSYKGLYRSKDYAQACAEEALEEMAYNVSYSSTGNLNFGNVNEVCNYLIVALGGGIYHIQSTGNSGFSPRIATYKVRVIISSLSPIVISSWQEVDSF